MLVVFNWHPKHNEGRLPVDYCGIDLAGMSSYVYVTDDRGRRLTAGEVATEIAYHVLREETVYDAARLKRVAA